MWSGGDDGSEASCGVLNCKVDAATSPALVDLLPIISPHNSDGRWSRSGDASAERRSAY